MAVNRKDTPKARPSVAPRSPSVSTPSRQLLRDIKQWSREDGAKKSSKKKGR